MQLLYFFPRIDAEMMLPVGNYSCVVVFLEWNAKTSLLPDRQHNLQICLLTHNFKVIRDKAGSQYNPVEFTCIVGPTVGTAAVSLLFSVS